MNKYLFFIMFFCCSSWGVTYEEALNDYVKKDFESAYAGFEELSRFGNDRAQYNIAIMYVRGEHAPKDFVKAMAWAYLAKDSGSKTVDTLITVLQKKLNDKQSALVNEQFQSLKMKYGTEALQKSVLLSFDTQNVAAKSSRLQYSVRPKYPRDRAQKSDYGWVDVQLAIGKDGSTKFFTVIKSSHNSFSKTALEAVRGSKAEPALVGQRPLLELSVRHRYSFLMAGSKIDADVFNQYIATQTKKLSSATSAEKLAFAYQLRGQESLASYMTGSESLQSQSASHWFQQAAQDGQPLAKYELGLGALHGRQCEIDNGKSLLWLKSAADDNVLDAKMALGYEYLTGVRFPKDLHAGLGLIKESANKGLNHAKVLYVWLESTLPELENRDLKSADSMLSSINVSGYSDPRSYYESKTALALAKTDWKLAKKSLKKLKKINKKYDVSRVRELALAASLDSKIPFIELP